MKPQTIEKLVRTFGISEHLARYLDTRRSGKSTSLALHFISEAISKPNTHVTVKDHYGSRNADKHLLRMCAQTVEKLELVGFKFNLNKNTVIFDLSELQKKNFGFALE